MGERDFHGREAPGDWPGLERLRDTREQFKIINIMIFNIISYRCVQEGTAGPHPGAKPGDGARM